MNRCILIFPKFSNMHIIDHIREQSDPLAQHVRPHITLVFPFYSRLETAELEAHLRDKLSEVSPFALTLRGITPAAGHGNYFCLNVEQGMEELVAIHNKLYTGVLERFKPEWLEHTLYRPHLTVGRIPEKDSYLAAIDATRSLHDVFSTIVDKVSVEIISETEDSTLELEGDLRESKSKIEE